MRIVLDALPLQVRSAGIAEYTDSLVRALAAQHPDDELELFGTAFAALLPGGAPARPPYPPNVRWRTSAAYQLITGAPLLGLPRLIMLERALGSLAVYHATNYVMPRTRAVPVVLTVHDLALIRHPELGTPALRRMIAALPAAVAAARLIITGSTATAHDLQELLGVAAERIRIVPYGCAARFQPIADSVARRTVLRRYGIDPPFVLHVGTIEPRKNLPALVRAFARVCADGAGAHRLVLAGAPGWGIDALRAALAASPVADRIHLAGSIDGADLPALYSSADLFVYPSLYEGFGLPVIEAMACGVPVLTGDGPALSEVAGDAARRVDPRDEAAIGAAMVELLGDASERQALVERGRERARQFSWERCARETYAVYGEAARG